MSVNVLTEIEIDRPYEQVAAFAAEPSNAPLWYDNIRAAEWQTAPPLAVGSEVSFVAFFLGKRLAYTYRILELEPGAKLVMSTSEGPFPMQTTYTWRALGEAKTLMKLRNAGLPSGFSKLTAPLMAAAMKRANRKDLVKLKTLLEAQ